MDTTKKAPNRLINEKSPYLLQHAYNPVDWYPWCEESLERARKEEKPIFLSIGYSTCHWCHVMAHESFEDDETAAILNNHFISIKVDKEERPDIDSIYMSVCQAFTGSGGWPTSIFMTPEQKPFFAGTYFPPHTHMGRFGFQDIILAVANKWEGDRESLLQSAEEIVNVLKKTDNQMGEIDHSVFAEALSLFKQSFDREWGGFGVEPKFPSPHNLLFLLRQYGICKEREVLEMVETTLVQMYKGGIFDHIGFGFSRYSTDRYFLVPHFEKMLYDNALLIAAYACAYRITKKPLYREVAEKTATYILREMTSPDGGFYSAQDADSDGIEGKYYVFDYDETLNVLGKNAGKEFNRHYDITKQGNFEGKNIPNLLHNQKVESLDHYLPELYAYRKTRTKLHLDDKILTSWNSLNIAAFATLYRVTHVEAYLLAARKAQEFIEENLMDQNNLYVSWRNGRHSEKGFLDDYAYYVLALVNLYEATLDKEYLEKAQCFCRKVIADFYDTQGGGFYLYGTENEQLIFTPKETYDGAMPSGNSVMAYNLVKLSQLTKESALEEMAEKQLKFLAGEASAYPTGYSFYLTALSLYLTPPQSITVVLRSSEDLEQVKKELQMAELSVGEFPEGANVIILESATDEYKLLNDKTTYYVCKDYSCQPPVNHLC